MKVYNARVEIMVELKHSEKLLDNVIACLRKEFGCIPLRFAIVGVKANKLIVEASVVGE